MIDPKAVVDPSAKIADDVSIGPFTVIGSDVEIGRGTWVGPNVVINGPCRIGEDNQIFQFASVGELPQDKKYAGEATLLDVGDRNVIREFCTLNRGTVQGGGVTKIGDDNWIMAYVHIAHDCLVGSNTIFANNTNLAGHVTIEDYVILGGSSLVHQFVRVGAHSFCGMGSAIAKDIPTYMMVAGQPASPHGLNTEGLKRRGFSSEEILELRRAYKVIYRSGLRTEQAIEQLQPIVDRCEAVAPLQEFLKVSERGIAR